ncbi:rRNA maturation RNase YbeY [Allorhizobium undicola]|uniref:rRNA maturation RNase YbeY n=1 Tax=Allorhizobium undicola TaxID=78527 RepID=UPI0004853723|nr:rRNA maturation RNase YbeY [Allorhizobium undicola]
MSKLEIQLAVENGDWPTEAELEALSARVLGAASDFIAREEGQPFPEHPVEVSLVFINDDDIRGINAEWRGQDKPTNVLSFPAYPIEPGDRPGPMLGDIIIAYETVAREAVDLDKSFSDHLTHLMVHGFLHLFGYDHMETGEAEEMEGLETRILAELGLSDPYAGQEAL